MPMNRALYPEEWEAITASIRARAGNRCEWPGCGVENGALVIGKRGRHYHIVLTVAHLNHDTRDNDPANLRAWCQTHHLRYDATLHAQHAAATRKAKEAPPADIAAPPLWDL